MSTLQELIESDSQASALFAAGNDSGCAARLVEIAHKIRKPVPAADIQYYAAISGAWAAIKIARESAETPNQIKAACITFIDWVQSGRPIDFDLPVVQQMLGGLVLAGLVTQELADQMDELQDVPQAITADMVSAVRAVE